MEMESGSFRLGKGNYTAIPVRRYAHGWAHGWRRKRTEKSKEQKDKMRRRSHTVRWRHKYLVRTDRRTDGRRTTGDRVDKKKKQLDTAEFEEAREASSDASRPKQDPPNTPAAARAPPDVLPDKRRMAIDGGQKENNTVACAGFSLESMAPFLPFSQRGRALIMPQACVIEPALHVSIPPAQNTKKDAPSRPLTPTPADEQGGSMAQHARLGAPHDSVKGS